jgi:hypothetical protein
MGIKHERPTTQKHNFREFKLPSATDRGLSQNLHCPITPESYRARSTFTS